MAKKLANVETNRCVACGVCALECPKEAIRVWKGCYAIVDNKLCVGCGKCSKLCPADCIQIDKREEA
ncbi:4Fe-4S ferredoxin, iron-sulfur binding protein [Lachnospiraceae bacterium TWA4]|nr:4Fe-4S ferredoxin, iron-sulfur binding protein [Lachnospiraceae bacterium TWA4]